MKNIPINNILIIFLFIVTLCYDNKTNEGTLYYDSETNEGTLYYDNKTNEGTFYYDNKTNEGTLYYDIETNEIFSNIYSKMYLLPSENRLIFGINRTCIYDKDISNSLKSIYSNNSIYFCLYNNKVFMLVNQTNFIKLFDSNYIKDDFFYDFNIYKGEINDIECIISCSNKNKEIKFYHHIINISDNYQIYEKYSEYYFNTSALLSRGLSCQKINLENILICFYSDGLSSFYISSFNITNNFEKIKNNSYKIGEFYDKKNEIIRSSLIKYKNQFFVCKIYNYHCDCTLYDYNNNIFQNINFINKDCRFDKEDEISSYYFEETQEIL